MSAHLDSPLCLFSQSRKLLLLLKFGSDCLTWAVGERQKTKKQRGNIWTHYHYQSRVPGPVSDGRCLIVADDSFRLVCHDCSASTPPALQTPPEDFCRPWESCSSFHWGGRQPALSTLVSICQPMAKARGCWIGLCTVFVFYLFFCLATSGCFCLLGCLDTTDV